MIGYKHNNDETSKQDKDFRSLKGTLRNLAFGAALAATAAITSCGGADLKGNNQGFGFQTPTVSGTIATTADSSGSYFNVVSNGAVTAQVPLNSAIVKSAPVVEGSDLIYGATQASNNVIGSLDLETNTLRDSTLQIPVEPKVMFLANPTTLIAAGSPEKPGYPIAVITLNGTDTANYSYALLKSNSVPSFANVQNESNIAVLSGSEGVSIMSTTQPVSVFNTIPTGELPASSASVGPDGKLYASGAKSLVYITENPLADNTYNGLWDILWFLPSANSINDYAGQVIFSQDGTKAYYGAASPIDRQPQYISVIDTVNVIEGCTQGGQPCYIDAGNSTVAPVVASSADKKSMYAIILDRTADSTQVGIDVIDTNAVSAVYYPLVTIPGSETPTFNKILVSPDGKTLSICGGNGTGENPVSLYQLRLDTNQVSSIALRGSGTECFLTNANVIPPT